VELQVITKSLWPGHVLQTLPGNNIPHFADVSSVQ